MKLFIYLDLIKIDRKDCSTFIYTQNCFKINIWKFSRFSKLSIDFFELIQIKLTISSEYHSGNLCFSIILAIFSPACGSVFKAQIHYFVGFYPWSNDLSSTFLIVLLIRNCCVKACDDKLVRIYELANILQECYFLWTVNCVQIKYHCRASYCHLQKIFVIFKLSFFVRHIRFDVQMRRLRNRSKDNVVCISLAYNIVKVDCFLYFAIYRLIYFGFFNLIEFISIKFCYPDFLFFFIPLNKLISNDAEVSIL